METLLNSKEIFRKQMLTLQNSITQELMKVDPDLILQEDPWQRKDYNGEKGGGGLTRAFNGEVIENAGVNTSTIWGAVDPSFAKSLLSSFQKDKEVKTFTQANVWASGLSLIIHPRNPKVPSVHANFRMIHIDQGEEGKSHFWFGGGADLTPFYPFEEDFIYFHQTWAQAAAPFGKYQDMKKTCDEYFVNHHREKEMRGIGGIFFDHHSTGDVEKDAEMVLSLSKAFIPSYFPLVQKRKGEEWNQEDEDFQLHRRGRYVEFNLLHDRGTSFGLRSNGRTDSILISLPARCKFTYKYTPRKNSPHEKMQSYYYPRDWI